MFFSTNYSTILLTSVKTVNGSVIDFIFKDRVRSLNCSITVFLARF